MRKLVNICYEIMKAVIEFVFIFLFAYSVFPCTVNISSIKTNSIYGRVIDENKSLIPNAKIQIYKNTDNGEEILAETISDENGKFEIKDFPAGKYMIKAGSEHFAYSYASVKLNKTLSNVKYKEIVFTLVPIGECSGWVDMQKIQKTK